MQWCTSTFYAFFALFVLSYAEKVPPSLTWPSVFSVVIDAVKLADGMLTV